MSMTMIVGTFLIPRENGILGESTKEVPHLPGNGQVASGLQWSLGTTPYFCLTRPCAGRLLAHFQVLSLHPIPHTGHVPILTQGVVTLHDPYTSCICPELCLRQKDSVSDQFSGLSSPGLLDLSLTPGVESPGRDPCLPLPCGSAYLPITVYTSPLIPSAAQVWFMTIIFSIASCKVSMGNQIWSPSLCGEL